MSGFISLHRKITDHWVFNRSDYFKAWVTMLMNVNHKSTKVLIGSSLIDCNRGQSLNSLNTWVERFGDDWTMQKVRTFFKLLQNDQMINTENVSKTTRLTICNYESYQSKQHGSNTQPNTEVTRLQHDCNTSATSNNKGNNANNENNDNKYKPRKAVDDFSQIDKNIWNEWIDFRTKRKLSQTERSINANIKCLKEIGLDQANEVLSQSMDRGWTKLYPLDDKKPKLSDLSQTQQLAVKIEGYSIERALKEIV